MVFLGPPFWVQHHHLMHDHIDVHALYGVHLYAFFSYCLPFSIFSFGFSFISYLGLERCMLAASDEARTVTWFDDDLYV